jgi:hypothetical protein
VSALCFAHSLFVQTLHRGLQSLFAWKISWLQQGPLEITRDHLCLWPADALKCVRNTLQCFCSIATKKMSLEIFENVGHWALSKSWIETPLIETVPTLCIYYFKSDQLLLGMKTRCENVGVLWFG